MPTPPRPDNSNEGAMSAGEWARLIPARYQNPPSPQLPPAVQAILMGINQSVANQQQAIPLDTLRMYGGAGNYNAWQSQGGYPGPTGPVPWIRPEAPPYQMPGPVQHHLPVPMPGNAGTRG